MDVETAEPTPDTERSCASCGSGMQAHQDWCLECGTAAAGRLGGLRPGWRVVTTTLALTLALVGGAGAASYAALSSDATREAMAAAPVDGTPVAQVPPAVPAPPAPTVPPIATPVAPTPTVAAPAAKLPVAPKAKPVAPVDKKTTAQVTPPVAKPKATPKPAAPAPASTPRSTSTGRRGAGTNAEGKDTAADVKLTPIALGANAISVYDPYDRAVKPGDPTDAYDGDARSTFTLGAPDDGRQLQVGVVVDLAAAKQVRGVELTTTTPGGRVEVYATDGSALPPDILDTRWDHPATRADVGTRSGSTAGDGVERIVFPKGGAKYRYVTLWFTTAPTGTRRVGITELKILG